MKKLLIVVILLIISINVKAATYLLGDVDGNSKVEVRDYILVRKHLLDIKKLTGDNLKRADANEDNAINSKDYILIRKYILNGTFIPASTPTVTLYTINYYGNGATSGHVASHTCASGSSCSIKANGFTNSGYTFVGWTTNRDGTADNYNWTNWSGTWNYTNGQYGISNNTLNLYAMWKTNNTNSVYTINYFGNGATSGSVTSHACFSGGSCTIRANSFIKSGYAFAGWTTNSNGTDDGYKWATRSGTWNYTNGQYGISNNTLNLYAMWEKSASFTVNYYGNGATSGSVASHTCTGGSSCAIKTNGFIKSGYTFVGWTTNSNGAADSYNWTNWSGTWNYTNGQYGISNNTLNLYAMWKENTNYTINYYGNGATSGSVASHTCTKGGSCAIKANGFAKTGYAFVGWTTNSNGVADGYSWTNWSGTWNYTNGQYGINNYTLNLYAIWERVYVIAEDTKLNGYSQVTSCTSETLKYKIVSISGSDYVFIWAKDAYNQLNSALAKPSGKGTASAEKILANEISTYGYQSKCMVATNASFFNMGSGIINAGVVISKGKVVINEGKVWPAFGLTKSGVLKEYYGEGLEPIQADGVRNTFAHSSKVTPSNGGSDSTNRTVICQIDANNYAIASGGQATGRLAYQINQIAPVSVCYNLDGGGSRKLYYKGKNSATMTKRFGGDRTIPDMLYFVEK